MKQLFAPSLMCADLRHLEAEVRALEAAGADIFHIDIMDGEFVDNFALSFMDLEVVKALTDRPVEVHLMVRNQAPYIRHALRMKADVVYIHYENGNVAELLTMIRKGGGRAGLAINPSSQFEEIVPLFPLIDSLLIMQVEPGFAGARKVDDIDQKIAALLELELEFALVLDGSCDVETIGKWASSGITQYVLGTSCGLFGKDKDRSGYGHMIHLLRTLG